jgi:hypothetical protein
MKRIIGLVIAGLWLFALASNAGALFCGDELVEVGDSKVEVLLACGEPMHAEVIGTEKWGGRKEILEEWTYYRGPGTFLQILTFRGGKLISIENGDRT